MIITIDGPTASGKSTVAKRLAKRLGFYYLGTGLMFRAIAYLLVNQASSSHDQLRNPQKKDLDLYLDPERFVYTYDNSGKILFDGQDLTPFLKTSEIDSASSIVSTNQNVRNALLKIQRLCGKKFDLVAEGRDVGSVVFPDADVKFFLTASTELRAQRWQQDQKKKGNEFSLDEAIEIINTRDQRDSSREVAPLVKPKDAFVIDNSEMSLEETLQKMVNFIKQAGG